MLPIGGVTFDTKDLVYSNALDTNVQYLFTDSTAVGSVLFKIPYGHQSQYLNPYAKSWINQHERYAGPIEYIIHLIGNATFSGELIIFWYPSDPGDSLPIYEMQKYSWATLGAQFPSTESMILKDARQDLFYRKSNVTYTDVPYIGVGVFVSLVSPLKDGVMARLRIQSKLCNGSECGEPFQVSNPIIGPQVSNTTNNNDTSLTFGELVSTVDIDPDIPLFMETDGRRQNPRATHLTYNNTAIKHFYQQNNFDSWTEVFGSGANSTSNPKAAHVSYIPSAGDNYWYVGVFDSPTSYRNGGNPFYPFDLGTTVTAARNRLSMGNLQDTQVYSAITEEVNLLTNINAIGPDGFKYDGVTCKVIYHITNDRGHYRYYELSHSPLLDTTTYSLDGPATGTAQDVDPLSPPIIRLGTANTAYVNTDHYPMLPSGWTALKFTNELPFAVSDVITASNVQTNVPDYRVYHTFHKLALKHGVTDNTFLQFSLKDPETGYIVAVIRYHHIRRTFMVNTYPGQEYQLFEGQLTNLVITDLAVVNPSVTLPITDTSYWTSRLLGGLLHSNRAIAIHNNHVGEPNIWGMMAGGALGGIGGAIGQNSQNQHSLKMQEKGHENNLQMLQRQHEYGTIMQDDMQSHEHELLAAKHVQQGMMQGAEHAQQSKMQMQGHQNKLTVAGASSKIRSGRV
jgi:hypothetical protein